MVCQMVVLRRYPPGWRDFALGLHPISMVSSTRGVAVNLEGTGFYFLGVVEMLQLILKVVSVDRGLG